MAEKTKRTSTPERVRTMGSFALFEVGFIGRVVGVRVRVDFNLSLDGCATGVPQPNLEWLPPVIVDGRWRLTSLRPPQTGSELDQNLGDKYSLQISNKTK